MTSLPPPVPNPQDEARQRAYQRIKAKRGFWTHVVTYLVVNLFLVGVWYFTSPGGYFWPVWVMGGWGIGLAMNAWAVYGEKPISEADIDKEMRRGGY